MSTDRFFTLDRINNVKINLTKKPQNYFDKDIFEKYSKTREDVSISINSNIKGERDKLKELQTATNFLLGGKYLEYIFNMSNDLETFNYSDPLHKSTNKYKKQDTTQKYTNIISTMQNYDEIKDKHMCNREEIYNRYLLHRYIIAFNHLKQNGNMLIPIINFCHPETVDTIYLGLTIFEKLTIYTGMYMYCENFNPISTVSKITIENLLDRLPKTFTITPKHNLKQFENNMIYWFNTKYIYNKNLLNKNYDWIIEKTYIDFIQRINDTQNEEHYQKALPIIYQKFYEFFKHLYIDNKIIKIHSGIKTLEGKFLQNLVTHKKLKNIIEVGFAFGISAMFITTGIKNNKTNGKLISIDPFQTEQWKGNGVKLLKSLKLNKYHELIENKSYLVLPQLLEKNKENSFDMVFVDGWHTFDYTLLDTFYADKLVRIGGYIIIDDVLHYSVKQCIKYIDTNYKHLKRIKSPNTFAAYKKISQDNREWNFHVKI